MERCVLFYKYTTCESNSDPETSRNRFWEASRTSPEAPSGTQTVQFEPKRSILPRRVCQGGYGLCRQQERRAAGRAALRAEQRYCCQIGATHFGSDCFGPRKWLLLRIPSLPGLRPVRLALPQGVSRKPLPFPRFVFARQHRASGRNFKSQHKRGWARLAPTV